MQIQINYQMVGKLEVAPWPPIDESIWILLAPNRSLRTIAFFFVGIGWIKTVSLRECGVSPFQTCQDFWCTHEKETVCWTTLESGSSRLKLAATSEFSKWRHEDVTDNQLQDCRWGVVRILQKNMGFHMFSPKSLERGSTKEMWIPQGPYGLMV